MPKNICIIPARGGSKRIPRKNIKEFLGKPIIAYSIEAALNSGLFEEVMVSTEDKEIAEIAKKHGARVPFLRSSKNADDYATTIDVLKEVVQQYEENGKIFNNICCIYPTAPFTTEKLLKEAFQQLEEENRDAVFPVIPFSYPIQRALKIQNRKVSFFYPQFENTRSQDLEKSFHDAGQFYFFKKAEFLKNNTIFTKNTGGVVISDLEAQDIDNISDWKIAEIKYELLQNSK
ncbi:pseudaminic acid cytidylyltransferase [Zunongwangia sp. H14]|uniref:pseudaminic acid cytidylyltransferase n=1 Tax=Zunongwangia sp. H14 TaxID=3240792 RepID=UPI003563466E